MESKNLEVEGEVIERYKASEAEVIIIEKGKEVEYCIKEPEIEKKEMEKITTLIANFYSKKDIPYESSQKALEKEIEGLSSSIQYHARKRVSSYGRLYPLILDDNVLEIDTISCEKPIYIRHKHFLKYPFVKTNIRFESRKEQEESLERLKNKITPYSTENPYEGPVNGTFYAHIIIQKHPYDCICFLKRRLLLPSTTTWLIEEKMFSPQEVAYLWTMIETKTTIAIVGASREERRLLLDGFITMIPQKAKIMIIEKTPISSPYHEYSVKMFVSKENGLNYQKAIDIAQKQSMEYIIMDADDIEKEVKLSVSKTCFIYSCQTSLEIIDGAQVCIILPNNLSEDNIQYLEEIEGERKNITFGSSDTPKQLLERSKILQLWTETNHFSNDKVLESITLKANLVMYINGTRL